MQVTWYNLQANTNTHIKIFSLTHETKEQIYFSSNKVILDKSTSISSARVPEIA